MSLFWHTVRLIPVPNIRTCSLLSASSKSAVFFVATALWYSSPPSLPVEKLAKICKLPFESQGSPLLSDCPFKVQSADSFHVFLPLMLMSSELAYLPEAGRSLDGFFCARCLSECLWSCNEYFSSTEWLPSSMWLFRRYREKSRIDIVASKLWSFAMAVRVPIGRWRDVRQRVQSDRVCLHTLGI